LAAECNYMVLHFNAQIAPRIALWHLLENYLIYFVSKND
jgi:hypothetical protein